MVVGWCRERAGAKRRGRSRAAARRAPGLLRAHGAIAASGGGRAAGAAGGRVVVPAGVAAHRGTAVLAEPLNLRREERLDVARPQPVLEPAIAFLALFGAFELVSLYTGTLPNQVLRTVHVGFLGLIACGLLANAEETSRSGRAFWWAVGAVSFGVGLYHWWNYIELVNRAGELTGADMVVGITALIVPLLLWRRGVR